jgi:hypothetical protein
LERVSDRVSDMATGPCVVFTTSVGKAHLPFLTAPDPSDGLYSVTMEFEENDPIVQTLKNVVSEAASYAFGANLPYNFIDPINQSDAYDKRSYGMIYVLLKSTVSPLLVDALNIPLSRDIRVTEGDILRIAGWATAFRGQQSGVMLRLKMAKLISKAPEPHPRAATAFGDD